MKVFVVTKTWVLKGNSSTYIDSVCASKELANSKVEELYDSETHIDCVTGEIVDAGGYITSFCVEEHELVKG